LLALRSGSFNPGTKRLGGWEGLRTVLNVVVNIKFTTLWH